MFNASLGYTERFALNILTKVNPEKLSDSAPVSCSALLLNSVMSAFRAEFIATRSMDFIGMIKECDESGFPKVGS